MVSRVQCKWSYLLNYCNYKSKQTESSGAEHFKIYTTTSSVILTYSSGSASIKPPERYYARNRWCLFFVYSDASLDQAGLAVYVPDSGLVQTSVSSAIDLSAYSSGHLMKFGTRTSSSAPMPVTFIRAAQIYSS